MALFPLLGLLPLIVDIGCLLPRHNRRIQEQLEHDGCCWLPSQWRRGSMIHLCLLNERVSGVSWVLIEFSDLPHVTVDSPEYIS